MSIYSLYDRDILREKLVEVENTFLGLRTPISRFICDENGEVSETKIQELADRVIEKDCYIADEYVGMSGIRRRCYELLFYLVLRAYDPEKTVFYFEDFIKKVRELINAYKCCEELLLRETYRIGFEIPNCYFETIRNSCKMLTGKLITTDMSKEELDELEKAYRQKNDDYYKKKREMEQIYIVDNKVKEYIGNKYYEYRIEGDADYYDAFQNSILLNARGGLSEGAFNEMMEDEKMKVFDKESNRYLTPEEAQEWRDAEELRKAKWINSFENPQEYLDAYKELSEILYSVEIFSRDGYNLENALLGVLKDEGYNKTGNTEKLLKLMSSLDKSIRISRI